MGECDERARRGTGVPVGFVLFGIGIWYGVCDGLVVENGVMHYIRAGSSGLG